MFRSNFGICLVPDLVLPFFRSGILSVRETGGKQILSGNVVLVPVIVV